MKRSWIAVDLNTVLHGGLPPLSVLSGRQATHEIAVRFGLVTSQRVPPGGRVGNLLMQGLARMRLVPYARSTEVARIPLTALEARAERLRGFLSLGLALTSVLPWLVRPELPAIQPHGVIRGYDSVMVLFVLFFSAAVLLRPKVRVRVSTKDALKGRARLLVHPDFAAAIPPGMRRSMGSRNGRITG